MGKWVGAFIGVVVVLGVVFVGAFSMGWAAGAGEDAVCVAPSAMAGAAGLAGGSVLDG